MVVRQRGLAVSAVP